MIKNILVIGSGWLGLSLSKEIKKQGFIVTATTTTPDKVALASSDTPAIVHFDSHFSHHEEISDNAYDLIIITIPPRRADNDYLSQLMALHELTVALKIKRLLFISSTSVWGETEGVVSETTTMTPISESAKAMVTFEKFIKGQSHYEATTIKLAGLIGDKRHPGRFLAGKDNISAPNAPVNMVVREDVIGIILAVITEQQWQQSFIACAPSHPTRERFYTTAAKALKLIPASFSHESTATMGKLIDGSNTAQKLNYQFKHSDLMQWLKQ